MRAATSVERNKQSGAIVGCGNAVYRSTSIRITGTTFARVAGLPDRDIHFSRRDVEMAFFAGGNCPADGSPEFEIDKAKPPIVRRPRTMPRVNNSKRFMKRGDCVGENDVRTSYIAET